MKTVTFLIPVILVLVIQCEKDSRLNEKLQGSWELNMKTVEVVREQNGYATQEPFDKPPEIITFNNDTFTTYTISTKDTVVEKSSYEIEANNIFTGPDKILFGSFEFIDKQLEIKQSINENGKGYQKKTYSRFTGNLYK
jgi:hypothetical protein